MRQLYEKRLDLVGGVWENVLVPPGLPEVWLENPARTER